MRQPVRFSVIASLVTAFFLLAVHFTSAAPPQVAAAPLDVEQFQQTLDRQDVVGAIRLIELGWKFQYEEYYRGELTNELLEADAIRLRLASLSRSTGKRSALVYIVPTPDQLELILVPPTGQPFHRRISAVNRQTLLQFVQSFRDQVMDPDTSRSDYLPAAQRLYRVLIAPLERTLKAQRINTLIFCLGSGLRTVPIAALHDGKQFLVEKYNLAIIPAFNLLDHRPATLKGSRVLAMGTSQFESQAPLPAVPLELATIAKRLWSGEVLLDQNFTVKQLKAYRAKAPFGIVHLATHANFSAGSIANSYIQFWDQRLSPNHFRDLELRSPLVQLLVLSACRTAVGNPQAELGFAGLAVMSGSKSAIASLWPVSDVGTLVLMSEFYRQLKTTLKIEALRRTQIAMIRKQTSWRNNPALQNRGSLPLPKGEKAPDLSHPYYWAAFTLIGNAW